MINLLPTGIQASNQAELIEQIAQRYKDIYGQDIDLGESTPDGRRVRDEAKLIYDMYQVIIDLYNQLDPDKSSGRILDAHGKLNGITRRTETKSTWDIKITAAGSLTLPANYTIQDELGGKWEIRQPVELTEGGNIVTFTQTEWGAIEGLSSWELKAVTVVLGVRDIEPIDNALKGRDGETEEQFKMRRNKSLASGGQSMVASTASRLWLVDGVTDVKVHDNPTNFYDAEKELEAHALWCVVEGGQVQDILRVIAQEKNSGIPIKGQITGGIWETVQKPDGGTFQVLAEPQFDRPQYTSLHIQLDATRKIANSPVDAEQIKQQIAKMQLDIEQPLQAGRLYDYAYLAGDNFIITDIKISDDGINFTDGQLTPNYGHKFKIETENIIVNEIY